MNTLLDEIISYEIPGEIHSPGNCRCHACAQNNNNNNGSPLHWRARRQQRQDFLIPHPQQCHCVKCAQQHELEYDSNQAHTYWRNRRQQRLGWPVDTEQEQMEVIPANMYSPVPNPVTTFFGKSPHQILRKKPKGWQILPTINRRGWKMVDEKGNERIRFMRPNPRQKGTGQSWSHIGSGYWVIRDGQGNYLDDYGRVVAPNIAFNRMTEDQKNKIHVVFTGQIREMEF